MGAKKGCLFMKKSKTAKWWMVLVMAGLMLGFVPAAQVQAQDLDAAPCRVTARAKPIVPYRCVGVCSC